MNAARWLLTPLSGIYGGVVCGRNLYYDRVPLAVQYAGGPVISVGNLTAGGTGKTPMVIETVRRLQALGRHPAILTRGYGAGAEQIADEVLEFQDALPDVPVVVSPDRVAGAATAQRDHAADCLVLDDGFQHRRLARNLDIVLIDALHPWGGGWLLPAGRLREPLSSLRRAGLFVITRVNQVEPAAVERIVARLRRRGGDQPILRAAIEADALVRRDGRRTAPGELAGRRVLGVCGIGNPRTFQQLVSALVGRECRSLVFGDHHRYAAADVGAICAAAQRTAAELVVTTRKDWVKLVPLWPAAARELLRLDVRLVLQEPTEHFDARLRQSLEKHA